jgi:hypothetical protein
VIFNYNFELLAVFNGLLERFINDRQNTKYHKLMKTNKSFIPKCVSEVIKNILYESFIAIFSFENLCLSNNALNKTNLV